RYMERDEHHPALSRTGLGRGCLSSLSVWPRCAQPEKMRETWQSHARVSHFIKQTMVRNVNVSTHTHTHTHTNTHTHTHTHPLTHTHSHTEREREYKLIKAFCIMYNATTFALRDCRLGRG